MMKNFKLFGFLAASGIVFLTIFFSISYWNVTDSRRDRVIGSPDVVSLLPPRYLLDYSMWLLLTAGTVFLIVGILGIDRQRLEYLRPNRSLVRVLAYVAIPLFIIFSLFVSIMWLAALSVPGMHHPSSESDLTVEVSVNGTNPLVLFVKVKTFADDNLWLTEAHIKDYNQTTVAVGRGEWIIPCAIGSEETLTLDFDTTVPSGNYTLTLYDNYETTFVSPQFTVS